MMTREREMNQWGKMVPTKIKALVLVYEGHHITIL